MRAPPTSVASSAAILALRPRRRRALAPADLDRLSRADGRRLADATSSCPRRRRRGSGQADGDLRVAPIVLTCAAPTVRVSAAPTVSTRAAPTVMVCRSGDGLGVVRADRLGRVRPDEIVSSTPTVSERFLPTVSVSFDPIVTVRSTPTFVVLLLPTSSSRFTPTECLALLSMRSRLVVLHQLGAVVLDQQRVVLLRLEVDELRPGLVLEHQLVVAAAARRGVRLPARLRLGRRAARRAASAAAL